MRFAEHCRIVAFCLLAYFGAVVPGGADSLDFVKGSWVSINPPGPHVNFSQLAGGQREATLPILGQAVVSLSDGRSASNIRVTGTGFECFYLFTPLPPDRMVWDLKAGSAVCPTSAYFERFKDE